MKIAFLGLGRMGRELAAHLVADGHDVTVWNRTNAMMADLVDRGAHPARERVDAVAGAQVVITALFGPDAVRDVVIDVGAPIEDGAVWLDITTISPADANVFAAWAARRNIGYVHGPVIGSLAPARARKLGTLLGSENAAAIETAKELAVWADPDRIRTYDTAAKAAAAKLIANLTLAIAMEGLVEALRLGHPNGLETGDVLDVLDLTMLASVKALKGETVRTGTFANTQFSAALLAKDIRLSLDSTGKDLPAAAAVLAALDASIADGHGEHDFSTIAADDVT